MIRNALLGATLLASCGTVRAFDVGDPYFRRTEDRPRHRIEFVYDNLDRPVEHHFRSVLGGTAAGGPVASFLTPPPFESSIDGDAVIFRYSAFPLENVSAQFDLGVGGDSSAGDTTFIIGGAARALLVEGDVLQISTQVSGHYVPATDGVATGTHTDFGPFTARGESDFYEFGVALLAAAPLPTNDEWLATVYGGPRFSVNRGSTSTVVDYTDPITVGPTPIGTRAWFETEHEETSVLSGVIGVRVSYDDRWFGRVEGRFGDENSFSFSLGTNY